MQGSLWASQNPETVLLGSEVSKSELPSLANILLAVNLVILTLIFLLYVLEGYLSACHEKRASKEGSSGCEGHGGTHLQQ